MNPGEAFPRQNKDSQNHCGNEQNWPQHGNQLSTQTDRTVTGEHYSLRLPSIIVHCVLQSITVVLIETFFFRIFTNDHGGIKGIFRPMAVS